MNVFQIRNSVFNSNTYVVYTNETPFSILIDCGDADRIREYLESHRLNLEAIFITHGHYDHIYGLNDICKDFPKVKVYASEKSLTELFDPKLNYSLYHDDVFTFQMGKGHLHTLIDKQEIFLCPSLGTMEAISTPGHNEGCITYLLKPYLFTGDSFIPGIKTVTNLRGNKQQAVQSEAKIKAIIAERGVTVCPGHGEIKN